jgi:hypothetical protein
MYCYRSWNNAGRWTIWCVKNYRAAAATAGVVVVVLCRVSAMVLTVWSTWYDTAGLASLLGTADTKPLQFVAGTLSLCIHLSCSTVVVSSPLLFGLQLCYRGLLLYSTTGTNSCHAIPAAVCFFSSNIRRHDNKHVLVEGVALRTTTTARRVLLLRIGMFPPLVVSEESTAAAAVL